MVLEKKPRLCDVIEQSNEQIKQLQETMQSNSITSETRSKEREEDREFFRQMMGMMSQTMMGMTQMFMQGAASGFIHQIRQIHLQTTAFYQVEWAMAFTLHQLDHQAQLQAKHYLKIMIF